MSDGDKEFEQSQIRFKAEIINALALKVRLRLHELKSLDCIMHVGQPRSIPVTGPVDFHVVVALVQDTPHKPLELKLRVSPVVREEYRFATLRIDKDMDGFTGTLNGIAYGSWEAMYEGMLGEFEPKSRRTYAELIQLALQNERQRIMKEGIESHSDFGSW